MQWNLLCGNINQTNPSPLSRGCRFSQTHMRNLNLLREKEQENQTKQERKQCWIRSWILEKKIRAVFIIFSRSWLRTIQWRLRATCEWTLAFSKIVDYLSERLHKKDTVMRECVKSAKMCCLAIRLLFSESVQQH